MWHARGMVGARGTKGEAGKRGATSTGITVHKRNPDSSHAAEPLQQRKESYTTSDDHHITFEQSRQASLLLLHACSNSVVVIALIRHIPRYLSDHAAVHSHIGRGSLLSVYIAVTVDP